MRVSRSDKDLMAALGGGKSKAPRWARPLAGAVVLGLAWVLTWEWGLFLVLLAFGGWTAWAWFHEKGNVVDSFRDFVLFAALLATPLRAPMSGIADGFRGFGPAVVTAVTGRWNDVRRDAPTIQVNQVPATTTTTLPAEAAAGAPR